MELTIRLLDKSVRKSNRYSVGFEQNGKWVEAKRFNCLSTARAYFVTLGTEVLRLAAK